MADKAIGDAVHTLLWVLAISQNPAKKKAQAPSEKPAQLLKMEYPN